MTMSELAIAWEEYYDNHNGIITEELINDFANINATSYEEYMAIWELLVDAYREELYND
jgi:hypothetical protein